MKQKIEIIPNRFLGKNIIITGGTSGMGLAGAKRIAKEGGKICITGIADVCAIEDVEADFFDRMMNVNVRGAILQIAQLSKFLNNGASIVLTSSTSAYEGAPMTSVYAATKGAIISLSRCLASELASRNIRVNTLIPGAIDTNFRNFMSNELKKIFELNIISQVPLARVGTAEEAAAVALFLLSDESSYVTGSQYAVDGGLTMY